MKKINWDDYFLSMAFFVSRRSFDPNTKCGCIIVSEDKRILSSGYNGPVKKSIDEEIPLTRPEKYYHFIHAEMNALLSYGGSHSDIIGSTCYVTGRPCQDCMRSLIQKGIVKIIYCDLPNAKCVDQKTISAQKILLRHHPHVFIKKVSYKNVLKVIEETKKYILMKMR